MAKNPFKTTVGANDPIFQKAALQARFGKKFGQDQVRNVVGGLGGDFAQGGFEFADLMSPSAPNIAGLNPQEVAKRFAGQMQGSRRMLPGQELDWSKLSADIDLSDLLGANPDNNPLYSRNVNLQNLLSAGTDFSKAVQSQLTPMMASRLGGSNLSEGATAQAFIDAIKRDPNAGDPTATFADLEGAPTLSYSELQAHSAADPFSRNVLERIRNFTNTYDPSAPDKPMGQEQATFDAAVAAGVAADEEAAAAGGTPYDDSALRAQLSEQQDLIRSLSDRLNQPASAATFDDTGLRQGQGQTQAMLQQLLGREALGSGQLQELLAQSQEGRVTEDAISQIIQNQLMQADIQGQVGQAVQSEFGDVFTQAMIDRQSAEQQRFDTLMESLGQRQQQEERMAREQWARQDAVRAQQEAAVGETLRGAELAGRQAYGNVRGLPIITPEFGATDALRDQLQTSIMDRMRGTPLDAIEAERTAQLEEDASRSRDALTEKLSRLGLLRAGGDTADVLGEFEGQVLRGRQGIAADIQQMQQDLITSGIQEGRTLRGAEVDAELKRAASLSDQLSAARNLDLQRHMLQQDVADRTLARGLTRLGPTERERFENQMRAQQQQEYLARSAQDTQRESAEAAVSLDERRIALSEQEAQDRVNQSSADRGLRKLELDAQKSQFNRQLLHEQTQAELQRGFASTESELDRTFRGDESAAERTFRSNEAARQRMFDIDLRSAELDVQSSEAALDRELQQTLQTGQNKFAMELETTRQDFQATESGFARDQQLAMMRNENEQRLADRNLQESEANLNRLQQTAERVSAQNFERGIISQEHAQRQSDRQLQLDLSKNQIDAQSNLQKLQRQHEKDQAREQGIITREQANLNRLHDENLAQAARGFQSEQATADRQQQLVVQERDLLARAAESENLRTFQRDMAEDEQNFAREQNRFVSQQAQLDRDSASNESALQRNFISGQNYRDRQNQIFLQREQIDAQEAQKQNEYNFQREQNTFISQQADLDRQLQENESALQRNFISGQNYRDRQNQIFLQREQNEFNYNQAQNDYNFQRENNKWKEQQAEKDRFQQQQQFERTQDFTEDQAFVQQLQFGRQQDFAESEAAFARGLAQQQQDFTEDQAFIQQLQFGRQQDFAEQEAREARAFAQQQQQFAEDQAFISQQQFGRQQTFAETEAQKAREFARRQEDFERDRWEESRLQFGRTQTFAEQEAQQARDFAERQFQTQQGQFTRQQDFAEGQAGQDALYRAIGTLLAAQESGMDLGIGAGSGAPGGLAALLRAELGGALGKDLAYLGRL
tara:strand:+ start:856 stop:4755 length:3900 start_codon:yes stop_codon:yes gene_type:complete